MFEQTTSDLKNFHSIASQFWKNIPDDAWENKTGARDKDWTLHETLAHVLSIAQLFNKATDAALRGEELQVKGFEQREDLGAWNDEQIARLSRLAPNGLIVQLLQELRITHDKASQLTAETAEKTVFMPNFNRPARAIDTIHWQLSHAGVVHGAQVTQPLNMSPLWHQYNDDVLHRMVGHFLNQWSFVYWADLGSDTAQVINFHIDGEAGGDWHLVAAPDGGAHAEGSVDGAEFDLFFTSPDIFLSVFTGYMHMREAMVSGQMRLASDVRDTMAILGLFSPKKPKVE